MKNANKNQNDRKNEDKSSEELMKNIFCPLCLKYPEYSIDIKSNKEIFLIHTCLDNKKIEYNVLEKKKEYFE